MNGTGVGFSVERQFTQKNFQWLQRAFMSDTVIQVADSKLGWAHSKNYGYVIYWSDTKMGFVKDKTRRDTTQKNIWWSCITPEPLERLFEFCVTTFQHARGRKLSSIECHDIVCKVAEIVVVGGVRRSALISLSNLSDDRMRHAKSGQWWNDNGQETCK